MTPKNKWERVADELTRFNRMMRDRFDTRLISAKARERQVAEITQLLDDREPLRYVFDSKLPLFKIVVSEWGKTISNKQRRTHRPPFHPTHAGGFVWKERYIPRKVGGRWVPGEWTPVVVGPLVICSNGWHVTADPQAWHEPGASVFFAEVRGDTAPENFGVVSRHKFCARQMRLIRRARWVYDTNSIVIGAREVAR